MTVRVPCAWQALLAYLEDQKEQIEDLRRMAGISTNSPHRYVTALEIRFVLGKPVGLDIGEARFEGTVQFVRVGWYVLCAGRVRWQGDEVRARLREPGRLGDERSGCCWWTCRMRTRRRAAARENEDTGHEGRRICWM